ncbi:YqzK family protein [Neobacillus thermocopriae]|uniref:YqzK family protein n=1 Tax=Neobacillus thermocopriae TaxID=1215031 RepID=A0A6B3TW98_9BACI|nr:YqzK family protein [Neobacillus thermocopriae]NEX79897.1 YqzK family protein [Neobacillus thermocopriae]
MLSFIKILLKTLKVFIIFTGCTILFYYGIMWVSEEYQNYHRYDEPKGTALKVSNEVNNTSNSSLLDRLIYFYLNGE